jgi:hypothetical protein
LLYKGGEGTIKSLTNARIWRMDGIEIALQDSIPLRFMEVHEDVLVGLSATIGECYLWDLTNGRRLSTFPYPNNANTLVSGLIVREDSLMIQTKAALQTWNIC